MLGQYQRQEFNPKGDPDIGPKLGLELEVKVGIMSWILV